MSVFRRKFTYKGKTKRLARYTAKFQWAGRIYIRHGFVDRQTAEHWVKREQIRLSRNEVAMVKPSLSAETVGLIDDYCDYLESLQSDDKYIYNSRKRLNRLATECGWPTIGDISLESFTRWRAKKPTTYDRPLTGRTLNQYLDHAVAFCAWLVKPMAKLAVNPLDGATRVTASHNDKYRRAGTLDEFKKLLATCPDDRRLQYLFRLYCPLRRDSVCVLTWDHLHLDVREPFGELDVFENKSRRHVKFAIRRDLADLLKVARGDAGKDALVFPYVLTAPDLRKDLERAGVTYADDKGNRRLDFHAFRRSFVALAKQRETNVEDLHLALHHRDRKTTEKYYNEDAIDPRASTLVYRLPTLIGGKKGIKRTGGV